VKKMARRLLWFFFGFVGFLVAGIYFFLRSTLAPLDGELYLENLQHPVQVLRDSYGIPHVKAQNKNDALRALGFVMASERLFQMELSRRMTQGELSEVFGEIAIPSDKLYRSLMLRRSVERMLEYEKAQGLFDQVMWSEMEAYFDGINQYIKTHSLPYEFQILGVKPRPFTPIDAYVLTGHMAYSFGIAMKADPLFTKLSQRLPPQILQTLRNDPLEPPQNTAQHSVEIHFPGFDSFYPSFEGSNAWLLAPQRSASGKSIFVNDPHIGYSLPSVWFEAHIDTPEFKLYGHYLPLIPYAVLGHTLQHAWGFTMSLTDDMDLYRESLNRQKRATAFKNTFVPYQEWNEVIKVKNKPDLKLNLIETHHGPIMDEVFSEKNLALKWAFHRKENNPLKSLRLMATAQDIKSFEYALQFGTAPGLNVLYADSQNIAWWMFGDLVKKKNPHSDLILDGSTGLDEYDRLLSWNEKPHLINPPEGIIVSANSRPEQLSRDIRGDWQSPDRFETIRGILISKELWTSDDLKNLQTKNFNVQHRLITQELLKHLNLSKDQHQKHAKVLETMKTWDFHSELSSKGSSIFYEWNNQVINQLLKDWDEGDRKLYLELSHAWYFYERTLLSSNSPWWQELNKSDVITKAFILTAEKFEKIPTWGEIHTIEYVHPLGRKWPLNYIFNLGPYGIPGGFNEINNNKPKSLGSDFRVVAGPSTRRIIDFANPAKSWGINPVGISGHILSPYYNNQTKLFIEGKYRPQMMDEEEIKKNRSHNLVLNPK
jgi:penicillin amidase